MNAVDQIKLYDNVQLQKKRVNRNMYSKNWKVSYFSLLTKKDTVDLNICERYLSDGFEKDASKIIRQIESSHKIGSYFSEVCKLLRF